MPKNAKPSKPKFEPILIIRGKRRELSNEKKKKRDGSCNEEKKLGSKPKKLKAAIEEKFPYDAPQFSETCPCIRLRSSLKTSTSLSSWEDQPTKNYKFFHSFY